MGGQKMREKDPIKKIIEKIKGIKNIEYVIAILIIAIIISIYASTLNTPSSRSDNEKDTDSQTGIHWVKEEGIRDPQEIRLEQALSSIKGAGKVEVMITYKSGKEIVPAFSSVESTTVTQEEDNNGGTRSINQTDINTQPVTISNSEGSEPLVLKEVEPEIKGVIVIAEGADDIRVKLELLKATQIALGVKSNQVEVFVMEK